MYLEYRNISRRRITDDKRYHTLLQDPLPLEIYAANRTLGWAAVMLSNTRGRSSTRITRLPVLQEHRWSALARVAPLSQGPFGIGELFLLPMGILLVPWGAPLEGSMYHK